MTTTEKAFNALGDTTRRAIFEKLQGRPLSVAEISEGLPVSRPAVSQHIKVLKEARLITIWQKGTRSICQVDPEGVRAMRFYLDKFWDKSLDAFKAAAEKEQQNQLK